MPVITNASGFFASHPRLSKIIRAGLSAALAVMMIGVTQPGAVQASSTRTVTPSTPLVLAPAAKAPTGPAKAYFKPASAPLAQPGNVCFAEYTGDNTTDFSSADASAVQQAVDAASANAIVKVAGTCAGVQVRGGTTQTVVITKALTLAGGFTTTNWTTPNVANVTVLDAQTQGRVISATAAMTVSNLTIQRGSTAGAGAGAFFGDAAVLTGTTFLSNTASNAGGGASIAGAATLNGGLFQNNRSTGNNGGGLHANNTLTLTDTQFILNSAADAGGGAFAAGAVVLNNGRFERNSATANRGAGLYADSTLTLTGTQFISNTTTGGGGGGAFANGAATLNGGRFENNVTTFYGGGMATFSTLTLSGTQFISNTSFDDGGGAYAIGAVILNEGRFERNLAGFGAGGGLRTFGPLVLTNTQFISNTAITDGGGVRADTATLNGGLFISNTAGTTSAGGGLLASSVTLTDTQFFSNTANQGGGMRISGAATLNGGLFQNNRTLLSNGGGMWVGSLTLTGTQFISNSATGGGGAYVSGAATLTGGLFISNTAGQSGGGLRADGVLTVTGAQFINNTSQASGGGGLYQQGTANGRIVNTLFARNRAILGNAASFASAGTVNVIHTTVASPTASTVSAFFVSGGTVNITNTLIASHTVGIERAAGTVREDYTLFSGVVTPYSGTITSGGNSITGTAGFVNPSANDYQLTAASSAIDQGTDAGVTTDFFGNARPQGSGFDIGYNESPFTAPVDVCIATPDNGVTVFSGANANAVQQAVDAASANGTVKVAGYCAGVQTRAGTTQTVIITKALTLAGGFTTTNWTTPSVANVTVLDAQTQGRVIFANQPVTVSNLTVQNGSTSANGGGLYANNTAVLTGTEFLSNTASVYGGGVFASGATTLNGGWFENNMSNNTGGGLYAFNTLTLTGTAFISNTATINGGGVSVNGAATLNGGRFENNVSNSAGGGLFANNTVVLTGTEFISNTAASIGGGLFANNTVVLTGTAFISNTASGAGGGAFVSGAATLTGGRFENNMSNNTGGGMYAEDTLVLTGTAFISNTATAQGGGARVNGAATLNGGQFENNVSNSTGGGVWANSTLVLTGTSFISNTAASAGGGASVNGAVTLNGGRFENNRSTNSAGGGLYANSTAVLTGTAFISNTAQVQGGGARVSGAATLNGGRFENNRSTNSDGGGLYANSTAVLAGTAFLSNTAEGAGGGAFASGATTLNGGRFENNVSNNIGGGLYVFNTLALTGTEFLSNTATGTGGGVRVNGAATLNGGRFENNVSNSDGGGLFANNPAVLTGTEFISNTATGTGGGLYHASGNARIVNALFARNRAGTTQGMASYFNSSGIIAVIHTTVASPSLASGSALFVNAGTVNLTNTLISSHTVGLRRNGGTVNENFTLFSSVTTPTLGTINSGGNSITGTAGFVNPAIDNYRILSTSLAVNAGTNAGVTTDFFGNARPFGAGFDIGFDEVQSDPPPCWATPDNGVTVFSSANANAVQQAVDAAAANGTVKVAGTCAGVQFRGGNNQTVYLSKTLTLAGGFTATNWSTSDPIANPTVLDAQTLGRVFFATATVTMSDLTAQRGRISGDGGGGFFGAASVLIGTSFISNTTIITNNDGGGAYFNDTAVLIGGSFISNTVQNAFGGGAFFNNAVTLSSTTFIRNSAAGGTGSGFGGGAFVQIFGSAILTDVTFISNTATGAGGGLSAGALITLTGGLFQNNTTTGSGSQGGGLFTDLIPLVLSGTQFISNTASGSGGGVFVRRTAEMNGGLFISNTATSGGGALIVQAATLSGTAFISNTARADGGGAQFAGGATLTRTTFISNTAVNGGGILNSAGMLRVSASQFSANRATSGGGLYNYNGGNTTLDASTFTSNTATGAGNGGAVFNSGSTSEITIINGSMFRANTTSNVGGGFLNSAGTMRLFNSTVVSNTSPTFGGGFYNQTGGQLIIDNSDIAANQAISAGAGIHMLGATSALTITNSRLLSNTGTTNGGAVYQQAGSTSVNGSCIVGNSITAVNYAGGTAPITATANWWGSPSGPSGAGSGVGDSVSSNVDFSGFLGAAILGCPALPSPDVAISKAVTPSSGLAGSAITYTLAISNAGLGSAGGVVISDSVPAGTDITGVSSSGAVITQTSGAPNFAWQVSALAPNRGGVITLTGTISTSAVAGVITNTAIITAGGDSNATNNSASVTSTVEASCVAPSTTYVDDDWTGTPNGSDPDGAGPATNFGCDAFATVQGGINGVTTGGNVIVAAGTYLQAQVYITKSVTVTGAGPATTILNGQNIAPPTGGLVRIEPPLGDAGAVVFSGFTVISPGSGGGGRYGMFIKPLDPSAIVTVTNSRIAGGNNSDYGLYIYRNRGAVVFTGNVITNTGFNGVLIEQPIGATEFSSNTLTVAGASTSYFQMTYGGEDVTTTQRVAYNTINSPLASGILFNPSTVNVGAGSRYGKYTRVEIVGNTITNLGVSRNGIGLLNDTTDTSGAAGAFDSPLVMSNTITGTGALTSTGIQLRGLSMNANIRYNDIRNLARSIAGVIVNTHAPTGTVARYNNFVNNTRGLDWSANPTSMLDAENNWWGCNAGPGSAGCDPITGTQAVVVDFTPWIVLNVAASPSAIQPFGVATVTADLTQNSTPAAAGGTTPGMPVVFTANEGTIPSPGTIVAGTASALFTSNSANSAVVCATVDNQTLCTGIVITASVGLSKQASAANALPGAALTYTLAFSNAGPGTATGTIITDSLPAAFMLDSVSSSGATITQTSGAPNFSWLVSNLAANAGGVITLTGTVSNNPSLIGTSITNTAGITADNDGDVLNNIASAATTIIAPSVCYATPDNGTTVFDSANADAVQNAVDAASANGTVRVTGYCAGVQTRAGTTQTVYISKTLTLMGGFTVTNWLTSDPVANPTVLDAQQGGRVIYATQPMTASALTVQRGYVPGAGSIYGGGIYADSDMTLINMRVLSNSLDDGEFNAGGGAYIKGIAVVSSTTFMSNSTRLGGGAYFFGAASVTGASFISNTASQFGGGAQTEGIAVLTDTHFLSNTSGIASGGAHFMNRATLYRVDFTDNRADNTAGGASFLGAAALTETTFTRNTSLYTGGGWFWRAASVAGSIFLSNTAQYNGGGAWFNDTATVASTSFLSNSSQSAGGGLYAERALTLTDAIFISNTASGTAFEQGGGGAYIKGAATLVNSRFERNTAALDGGGLMAYTTLDMTGTTFITNTAVRDGGGVRGVGDARIVDSTFNANSAQKAGGGVFDNALSMANTTFSANSAGAGSSSGGIAVNGIAALTDVTFTQNSAGSGGGGGANFGNTAVLTGGAFLSNTANFAGGGAYFNGAAIVSGTKFIGNRTLSNRGGGAYFNANATLNNTLFDSNIALADRGAGAYFRVGADVTGSRFISNTASNRAGGAYFNANATLTDTDFISNTGTARAGGVYIGGNGVVNRGLIQGNVCNSDCAGGGLFISGTLTLSGTQFVSNTVNGANSEGGGVYTSSDATITASTFFNNKSTSTGGGLFHGAGTLTLAGSTFAANRTDGFGGGLNVANTSVANVIGSTFESNTASSGGGIVVAGTAVLNVTSSTFAGNQAGTGTGELGGGIYSFGNANIANSTFAGNSANVGGGLGNGGVMTLTNSTLSANTAITGAGIANDTDIASPATLLRNTLLAGQTAGTNCGFSTGTFAADGSNIADDASCDAATQKPTAQIALGPLADNGGGTKTMALGANSAALEAGNDAVCAAPPVNNLDQRGVTRPQVLRCDVGAFELQWTNNTPIADAGAPQTALVNTLVMLDGSGSSDPDGHALTYGWSQVSGTSVTLDDSAAVSPTFTTPNVIGELVFQLIVTDAFGAVSAPSFVTVTVGNNAPIANAGAPQSALVNTLVTLNGSGSSDPDGHALTYGWSQVSGTSVTLSSDTAISPTFTTPGVTGELVFQLIVTDAYGLVSMPSFVTVTVGNGAPIANAGTPQTALVNTLVMLNGSGSSDPDGHALTYGWSQVSGTSVTLDDSTAISPTFTTPNVIGELVFQLVVTDAFGAVSSPSFVTVTVGNGAPIANAGTPQTALVNTLVMLNGSGSSDPDGHALTYGWSLVSGISVALSSDTAVSPTFTTPNVTGELVFQLIVTDAFGAVSSPSFVTVTVGNGAPVANAGTPQTAVVNALVTLNGSASSDPNGHALTYGWSQFSGASVLLSSNNAISPTFVAPFTTGELVFQLIVTDAFGLASAPAYVTVTVTNGEPTANAGAPQTVYVNSPATLNGSASSDPENQPLTFGWSQVSGTAVALSSNSAVSPTFTTPAITDTLVFQLIVTDSAGFPSAPAFVTITVITQPVTEIPPSGAVITATTGEAFLQPSVEFSSTLGDGSEPVTYTWDFGDGSPIYTGTTASHHYLPGTYTATLTATNSAGSVTTTFIVVVPWRMLLSIMVKESPLPFWLQQR